MDWREEFFAFLTAMTSVTHGKQQYFQQDDGTIYSRVSGRYLRLEDVEREYIKELEELSE